MIRRKTLLIASKPDKKGNITQITDLEAYHYAIGSVLGDGSINKRDGCIDHEQRSARYLMWKRKIAERSGLVSTGLGNFKKKLKLAHGSIVIALPFTWKGRWMKNGPGGKRVFRRGWGFTTRCLFHKGWREAFYTPKDKQTSTTVQYRKTLPHNIKELFWGDLALAIFYFDDGWYDWEKETVRLATGEWTRSECELMVECLQENFNIKSIIYPLNGQPVHLFVPRASYPEFYRRVKPYYDDLLNNYPRYALNEK
jgi:hypothetical protein